MPYENQDLFDVAENGVQLDIVDATKRPKTVERTFYIDPGHGWLAVPYSDLKDLGLVRKISSCSYIKGSTVFLEEDCDAPLYLEAQRARDVTVKVNEVYQDPTPIRNYPPFHG